MPEQFTTAPPPSGPGAFPADQTDWPALARQLSLIQSRLFHGDGEPALHGDAFYGEALRRLLTGPPRSGFLREAEHQWLMDSARLLDQLHLQTARREAAEARQQYGTAQVKLRAELAAWLREVTNDRTVASRYRREGILTAADWLDPTTPAGPHTR